MQVKNNTKHNFPWEREKINFKVQRNCAKVKFHHLLHFTRVLSSFSSEVEVQHLFLTFGVAGNNFFEKIFKTVEQKFVIRCK